jgi:competence ComEA-like helix-hairpin-helix protein
MSTILHRDYVEHISKRLRRPVLQTCLTLTLLILAPYLQAVVDINTATAEELARELISIGPVKAQRIVAYRQEIGGFVTIEQLLEVTGIGAKTLAKNRHLIQISPNFNQSHRSANSAKIVADNTPPTPLPAVKMVPSFVAKPVVVQASHFLEWLLIGIFLAISLLMFVNAWQQNRVKDHAVVRRHLVTTTFTCANCGQEAQLLNIPYEGHFSQQAPDYHLPPGWSSIPNWRGELCDYCITCTVKTKNRIHPHHVD